jgi:transposase
MAKPVLQVKGHTPPSIKALFRTDEKYTIGLRLYAVYQVSLGMPSRQVEELYHTSFKQITNWVHQFEREGIEGLKDKPGRGRTSKLDQIARVRITALIKDESPTDHGYNTATWTGPLLIDWIQKQYNITYKKAQIYNIIKSLGFSHQKGRGVFPEKSEEKQQVFKDALKKTARRKS